MRELINQAEKVTREELSFMAFRLAAHYCELKFKALDDVLIIIEMVEAYEARFQNYVTIGDQIANNDDYYERFLAVAAERRAAFELARATMRFTVNGEAVSQLAML